MRHPLPLLIALLLAAPAAAEQFRYKARAGQVQRSRISLAGATMMGSGEQMVKSRFRSVLRQAARVRSVSGGVITLEVTETPISSVTTMNGQTDRTLEPPTRSLIRMTDRGRFLSRQRLGGGQAEEDSPLDGADALYGLNFPARDLKPGESWSETLTVGKTSPRRVTVTTRYVKKETFRGRPCARFHTTLTMPLLTDAEMAQFGDGPAPTGKVLGTLTTYFDPALGAEVYASGSISMVMRADLTALNPEAGTLGTVTKINVVQQMTK